MKQVNIAVQHYLASREWLISLAGKLNNGENLGMTPEQARESLDLIEEALNS